MKRILLYAIYFVNLAILFASCNGGKGGKTDPQPDTTTPEITSLSKTQVKETEIITITGKNFSATKDENIVKFNGKLTYVKAATATELTVYVPPFAKSGKVTVEVAGKTSTGTDITVEAFVGKRVITVAYMYDLEKEQLWASIDGGVSFAPIVTDVFANKNSVSKNYLIYGNDVYLASKSNGVIRSKDNGETWGKVDLGIPANTVIETRDIVTYNNLIIVAVYSATQYGGLYVSDNNGVSFTQALVEPNPIDLFVASNKAYLACESKKSYSSNNGNMWTAMSESWGVVGEEMCAIGATATKIFAGTRADGDFSEGKYIYSDDQGQTWKNYDLNNDIDQAYIFMNLNNELVLSCSGYMYKIKDDLSKVLLKEFFYTETMIAIENNKYYLTTGTSFASSTDLIQWQQISFLNIEKSSLQLFFFK